MTKLAAALVLGQLGSPVHDRVDGRDQVTLPGHLPALLGGHAGLDGVAAEAASLHLLGA